MMLPRTAKDMLPLALSDINRPSAQARGVTYLEPSRVAPVAQMDGEEEAK